MTKYRAKKAKPMQPQSLSADETASSGTVKANLKNILIWEFNVEQKLLILAL